MNRSLPAVVSVPLLAVVLALGAPPPADLGTFELDPVALLRDGAEVAGDPGLTLVHGHVTYRFSTPETKKAFEAEPDRYAVRQGGACARMGALSGVGRPELWAVHDGGLYFCASSQCRDSFGRAPKALLERDDEAPSATAEELARARAALDSCVEWLGGGDAIQALGSYAYRQQEEVRSGERVYNHTTRIIVLLPDAYMVRDAWDDSAWTYAILGERGHFDDDHKAIRLMDSDQVRETRRRLAQQLPVLMRAYLAGEARVAPAGADEELGGQRVLVHHFGRTSELVIEDGTGRVLAQRYRGWGGERGVLGTVEKRFTSWQTRGGVRMPSAWEFRHDGVRDEGRDAAEGSFEIVANAGLDPAMFDPPTE